MGSRPELGRAGKDYHVLAPAVINADKQFLNVEVEILDWSFFLSWWAEDKNVLKVKYEVVEEIDVQISMYEQHGHTEQAKHRLCTPLHLMGHE